MAKTVKKTKKISELLLPLSEVKTLAEGITSEKLSSYFFDATKLSHQPEPLYRLDMNGYRYYYRMVDNEPIFYTSVTTLIKNTLPTSPFLIKWLVDKGGDNGRDEAEERANYGTFLHGEFALLLITGTYDLDKLSSKLGQFALKEKIQIPKDWVTELKKDMLALAQFIIDKNVEPLAIEQILYHPTDGYAGALDLVCMLTIEERGFFGEVYASGANKGQPKESKRTRRVRAIIDLKSGRKSFYQSHEIQLGAYREMWNIHFPDLPVEMVANVAPKEWRTTPSYNFTDQTNSKNIAKLPYLVELAKIEEGKKDNKTLVTSGVIELFKGLDKNICEKTLTDLIKNESVSK